MESNVKMVEPMVQLGLTLDGACRPSLDTVGDVRKKAASVNATASLDQIRLAEARLTERFDDKMVVNHCLDRAMVSFQASKTESESRWFRYKEGFSGALVRFICDQVGLTQGHVLDPFAGSGTTLFAASGMGLDATGIELLPSSIEGVEVRRLLLGTDRLRIADALQAICNARGWEASGPERRFSHVRITEHAFPEKTEALLGRFLYHADHVGDPVVARVLRFAALCVLESVSFTRKDGQYLRWDHRSGRQNVNSNHFDKGHIAGFSEAICAKLDQMVGDLRRDETGAPTLFGSPDVGHMRGKIQVISGSCLDILPTIAAQCFDGLITSPPYCNRYDYTRTYALELAMLGVGEEDLRRLRQTMLSCTVENRAKDGLRGRYSPWLYTGAETAWKSQDLLQRVLSYLTACRDEGVLNNAGIPRMVGNYFLEMALVIFESARILKPGAPFVMVNDNVRYHGAHLPVDLILSDFAVQAGFEVEKIWVLPRGKGNSSQQMGAHGREELRKCVYIWRRAGIELLYQRASVLAVIQRRRSNASPRSLCYWPPCGSLDLGWR